MKCRIALFLLLVLMNIHLKAAEITMRTDLWCPYACDPKSDMPGFMIEIARDVFKKHGHTIQYDVMNWARALADVKNGQYDAVVGASRVDVEGFIIPRTPTGMMANYYWVLKDNPWIYKNPDSLKGKQFGIINDYSYGEEVDDLIGKKHPSLKKISGEWPIQRLIQMTENKRLDGFVENPLVLTYTLKKLKKKSDIFKSSGHNLTSDADLFIAFSPAKPMSREYAKILDDGLAELRKSGRLKVILERYGLSDWQ